MAVTLIKQTNLYIGASTDTKPSGANVKIGSKFYEYNTGKWYVTYNTGTNWVETSDDTVNANLQINDIDVSTTNLVPVKSNNSQVSATQTRPDNATPYSIGDVVGTDVATNMTFANVCSSVGAGFIITGCSLEIDVNAVPAGMTSFRLHLFNAAPTAITDNLAMNLIAADRAKYLGYIDLVTPVDLGDTLWSQNDNLNFKSKLAASTSIYGVLETRTAYTPAALTVKKVELKVVEV